MIDWEDIKRRHKIEDVMQKRGFKLRRSGTGLLCKCPLHDEQKGESFSIDVKKQLWKCFGRCMCGGDVIKLVMELDCVDATTAAEILEGRVLRADPNEARQAPRKEKRPAPEERVEVTQMRELPALPRLYKGERRHWESLATLRGLEWPAVEMAVRCGVVRFCLAYQQPAWAVLDVSNPCNVQVRRMDGELWFGRAKVMGMKNNWAKWPVGLSVLQMVHPPEVILVEGTGDFLAAYDAVANFHTGGVPIAMFGAANPIHEGALALLEGMNVRIIQQHDEAGAHASAHWAEQLIEAGARVRVVRVPTPGEDLNDHIKAGRDVEELFRE